MKSDIPLCTFGYRTIVFIMVLTSPLSANSGINNRLCATSNSLYCNDFSLITEGKLRTSPQEYLDLTTNRSKGVVVKEKTGGYHNNFYQDTGALKVMWNDGPEEGVGFGLSPLGLKKLGLESANSIYFGIMVWVSSESLKAANAEEWKHMAAETWDGFRYGPRPTLFMHPVDDTRRVKDSSLHNNNAGSKGKYYWIPMLASNANGDGVTDEAGNTGFWGASSHYTSGKSHDFTWNDYSDEWVYVEIKLSTIDAANPSHELYIYTQDGKFQGSKLKPGSPMVSVNSQIDLKSGRQHWYQIVPHYYLELTQGTTPSTFIKYDNFRINTEFMGPPVGFVE